ncbi:MAG: hypothetical protein M4579_002660 [Chaenotheca gracillima]|nr:MAG: hypothetical protein M4579_002660 [Chaenotheca gracillima]
MSASIPPSATSSTTTSSVVNIGSRKSRLAVIQTEIVRTALREAWPDLQFEVQTMSTAGDKDGTTALHSMAAKSLWTEELEVLLLDRRLDLIVHSLKADAPHTESDIPTQLPPTLTIGAIFPREDPRDALVVKPSLPYASLTALPTGSVIGTSSIRRTAQIARKYPGLKFENVRGNIDTRLAKLDAEDGKYACIILAAAGLKRAGLGHRITQYLDSKTERGDGQNGGVDPGDDGWLHAVGQGALGVEIREGDERIHNLLKRLACPKTTLSCLAERSLMRTLEGGCSVPIGVETEWVEPNPSSSAPGELSAGSELRMRATVTSTDGLSYVAACQTAHVDNETKSDEFGRAVAKELVEKGAGAILEQITLNRDIVNA